LFAIPLAGLTTFLRGCRQHLPLNRLPLNRLPLNRPPLSSAVRAFALAVCGQCVLVGCSERAEAQMGAPAAPAVSVAPALLRSLNDTEEFSGRLEAIEFVDLRPRVAGTIEKVHFTDGTLVRQGELLFTIDPRPFEAELARAQAQLAATEARSQLAALELERARLLLDSQAASRQEVDQLGSSLRTSLADLHGAEAALRTAQLNLGYTQVRAPISGRVSRAAFRTGNLVNEQSALTSIAGVSPIYAYFDGSEQSFLRLKTAGAGTKAPRVRIRLANEAGFPHEGRLDFIDNRLNPQTGAIRLRASFDNSKGEFTPGLSVRVRMESAASYQAVLVPERAIGTDQSRKFVFVVGSDGKAQYRQVTPGALFGTLRVVHSGVKPGENIVVDGLQRVVPGGAVAAQVVQIDEEGVPAPPAPPAPASAAAAARAKG
jgi:multidrug efflux system membrane fusion protein